MEQYVEIFSLLKDDPSMVECGTSDPDGVLELRKVGIRPNYIFIQSKGITFFFLLPSAILGDETEGKIPIERVIAYLRSVGAKPVEEGDPILDVYFPNK